MLVGELVKTVHQQGPFLLRLGDIVTQIGEALKATRVKSKVASQKALTNKERFVPVKGKK